MLSIYKKEDIKAGQWSGGQSALTRLQYKIFNYSFKDPYLFF